MPVTFHPTLQAYAVHSSNGQLQQVVFRNQPWPAAATDAHQAATIFVQEWAGAFGIPTCELTSPLKDSANSEPNSATQYRCVIQKRFFNSITFGLSLFHKGLPHFNEGIALTLETGRRRLLSLQVFRDPQPRQYGPHPGDKPLGLYQQMLANLPNLAEVSYGSSLYSTTDPVWSEFLIKELNLGLLQGASQRASIPNESVLRVIGGSLGYQKFDNRLSTATGFPNAAGNALQPHFPPVGDSFKAGHYYLCANLTLRIGSVEKLAQHWNILVDVATGKVIRVTPAEANVTGCVFDPDPVTAGHEELSPNASNEELAPLKKCLPLALNPPRNGIQKLEGDLVAITEISTARPGGNTPVISAGQNFDFPPRTDAFSAVCAYYHISKVLRTFQSLGFPLRPSEAGASAFLGNTQFPLPVDHRDDFDNRGPNARCVQSSVDRFAIHYIGFGWGNRSSEGTLGTAIDPWIAWHELGGHGTLIAHVGHVNFGFAHSPGDALAAIQIDPTSALRSRGLNDPYRFKFAPFGWSFPSGQREFGRSPTQGWAWGNRHIDDGDNGGGYNCEQLLASSLFRFYRSLGGDSPYEAVRIQAARAATYLILRAITQLTPGTNPSEVGMFRNQMIAADFAEWTTEGQSGYAYNKVITWAFEEQGLANAPNSPDGGTLGAAAAVDVYIDDGRGGAYPFQQVYWQNPSIWNRVQNDGFQNQIHQNAVEGRTNFAYVRIKNRGAQPATNIVVKAYHGRPGGGLVWRAAPALSDFIQIGDPAGITLASLAPGGEAVLGPFSWTPHPGGHACLLMVASCPEDPSNVDHLPAGAEIPEFRLVPHDNNIGQRNVVVVPPQAAAMHRFLRQFRITAKNPFKGPAKMAIQIATPPILKRHKWALSVKGGGATFTLAPDESRQIQLVLQAGEVLTPASLHRVRLREIVITIFAEQQVVGGVTLELPKMLA